jgi:hypothetical protein
MLNDAESYQGGNAGDSASEKLNDADALFRRLKRDVKADYNSKGQVNGRREAREDFDFEAGEQLNEEDKAILQDAKRPIVIFNRVGTMVDFLSTRCDRGSPDRTSGARSEVQAARAGPILRFDTIGFVFSVHA